MSKNSNGKILHLAINEKFIDHAYISFENVAAGRNDFFIFFDEFTSYIKETPHQVVRYRDRLGFALYQKIAAYDFVVVHSMHPFWISVINSCPAHVVFVWVGWGYDYYDLLYQEQRQLLLPMTLKLISSDIDAVKGTPPIHWPTKVRRGLERLRGLSPDKVAAIQRMSFYSPVLPNEYPMVQQAFCQQPFPAQCQWNYGSLEEVLLKGFIGRQCDGQNILVGNSASATSNHADMLQWLADNNLNQERKLVCPLSYGDKHYGSQISILGQQLFGDNFLPLINFMPLTDYLDLVSSCSYLVMNHIRQQGVGNILIMLYLGAMVFLREENPCFSYFKAHDFVVFSVQELQLQPELLQQGLSDQQKQHNRDLLFSIWSKQTLNNHTQQLIRLAETKRRCS